MSVSAARLASLGFMMSMAAACQMYTSVGQIVYYPAGSDHASAQYSLVIGVAGARGRAYVDRTSKSIHLMIRQDETQLLDREYRLTAGDLKWNVAWSTLDDLRIVFFEYGEPVPGKGTASDLSKTARQVLAVAFTFDKGAKTFIEAPAPVAVVAQIDQEVMRDNKRHTAQIYFHDSAENEARIISVVRDLAAKHGLQGKTPAPGLVGELAEWSAVDFSFSVQRYDSLRQVAVEIDDYTGHDLLTEVAVELRALPGLVRTRRSAGVKFRSCSQDPEATIRVVAPIAVKHGLNQMDRTSMFTVARFGTAALQVSVDFFESDGTMKILIEDFSWQTEFADIEQALRAGLNADHGCRGAGDA